MLIKQNTIKDGGSLRSFSSLGHEEFKIIVDEGLFGVSVVNGMDGSNQLDSYNY